MKQLFTTFFILFLVLLSFSSCVSRKKYLVLQTAATLKETGLQAENQKYRSISDSLKFVVAAKDSLIDSLTVKLNDMAMKREKERTKTIGSTVRKSTLTKEQEYEKKSLFLYNFTKYIEWPIEYNGTDFVIGVCGSDQMIKSLREFMLDKKVSGKRIIVVKYKKGPKYNVVYITSEQTGNFFSIKNAVKRNKTLLVTDDAAAGSHISFLLDQDKVRYIVDKISIEKTGLKVGQELMRYSG